MGVCVYVYGCVHTQMPTPLHAYGKGIVLKERKVYRGENRGELKRTFFTLWFFQGAIALFPETVHLFVLPNYIFPISLILDKIYPWKLF